MQGLDLQFSGKWPLIHIKQVLLLLQFVLAMRKGAFVAVVTSFVQSPVFAHFCFVLLGVAALATGIATLRVLSLILSIVRIVFVLVVTIVCFGCLLKIWPGPVKLRTFDIDYI